MTDRYFLKYGRGSWIGVTKEEFIRAEREAGFYPKGYNYLRGEGADVCATGGFGVGGIDSVAGRIRNDDRMSNGATKTED